jgi:hypothetical protein
MILLGCLLAFGIAVAPRAMLILAWIFSDRWARVWGGDFLVPLLGIIFLPFTTIMYMLSWSPTGIQGWDWLWIILGLILDLIHWGQVFDKRKEAYATATSVASRTGSSGTPSTTARSSAPVTTGTRPAAPAPAAAPKPPPPAAPAPPPPAAPPPASGDQPPGTGPSA